MMPILPAGLAWADREAFGRQQKRFIEFFDISLSRCGPQESLVKKPRVEADESGAYLR